MATNYGHGKIATNGLVFALDAGDLNSYPGSGTAWNNIASKSGNGTLTNGPTFSNRSIVFDGANDYIVFSNPNISLSTTQISISTWYWGNTTQTASTFFRGKNAAGGREFLAHLPWSNGNIYWDAGDNGAANTAFDRIYKTSNGDHQGWNHWVFIKNSTSGTMSIYRNGTLWHSGTSLTQPIGPIVTIELAGHAGSYTYDNGKLSGFQIYNRALTEDEVSQNYNAQKSRFGL